MFFLVTSFLCWIVRIDGNVSVVLKILVKFDVIFVGWLKKRIGRIEGVGIDQVAIMFI